MARRTTRRWAGVAGLVLVAGCYSGQRDDTQASGAADGDGDDDGDGSGADDGVPATCEGSTRGSARLVTRRLTRDEVLWSTEAIVGANVMQSSNVLGAAAVIPAESPGDLVADFQNGHAYEHANGLLLTAQAVAAETAGDPTARQTVFGACAAQADVACAEAFLDSTGLRILKRPLDKARRDSMLAGFSSAGGGLPGMQWLLSRLLQAPEAVFHIEQVRERCEPDCVAEPAVDGVLPVDDWSVGARLSYALTGRGPDVELLAAAAAGELRSAEQVRPHAKRLLATPQARRQFSALLNSWLLLGALPDANATIAAVAGIDPTGLAEEARAELLEYVTVFVFDRDADATELLGARMGFPRTPRLATLYGSAVATGTEPVALGDGHGGLALRLTSLLSGHRHTSPILRGAYVRKRLLCDQVPPPDPAEVAAGLAELDGADHTQFSTRALVEQLTSPPSCATCHQLINPIGFSLEAFDPLGRRRSEEIVYDADGNEVARHPLDTHVTDAGLEGDGPTELDGADDLLAALAQSQRVRSCIAKRFFSYGQLQPVEPAHRCAVAEVEDALVDGSTVKEAWLRSVVNAELFVRAAEESP